MSRRPGGRLVGGLASPKHHRGENNVANGVANPTSLSRDGQKKNQVVLYIETRKKNLQKMSKSSQKIEYLEK